MCGYKKFNKEPGNVQIDLSANIGSGVTSKFQLYTARAQHDDLPEGYEGILQKADITALMRSGDLEMSIIVLDDEILRYATTEMREYFSSLLNDRLANNMNWQSGSDRNPVPFFVSFRALGQEVRFEPYEVSIYSYGSEYRPIDIIPVSPNFMEGKAYIREKPLSAIYLYDNKLDVMTQDVEVNYFNQLHFRNWIRIIEAVNKAKADLELKRSQN